MTEKSVFHSLDPDNPLPRADLLDLAGEFRDFKLPFLPLYVDDFVADTMDLTAEEIGVYFALLMALWRRDCAPLPEDKLHRIARVTKARFRRHIWPEIGRFFQVENGTVWNRRLDEEWRKTATFSLKKRFSGKRGGSRKSLKVIDGGASNATSNAQASHTHISKDKPNGSSLEGGPGGNFQNEKRRKNATRMPDDFAPDDATARRLMADHDLRPEELNHCLQSMRDHAHANDRRQANWNAAFCNWVRKAIGYGDIGPGSRFRRTGGASQSRLDFGASPGDP